MKKKISIMLVELMILSIFYSIQPVANAAEGWPSKETEPNDTFTQAQKISENTQELKGQISKKDDFDWYKINISVQGHLKVTVKTKIWGASINLFQADGKNRINSYFQMWPSDGRPGSDTSTQEYDLKAGTYYLNIYGSYTGEYTIKTEFVQVGQDTEPNDTYNQAQTISENTLEFKGLRAYGDNYDWYKIDIPAEGHLKVTVKTKIWGASIGLFHADDKNRVNSYLQMWPSDGKPGSDTGTLEYDLKAGTYYLNVYGSYTGEYTIKTEFVRVGQDAEPNDTYNQAQRISENTLEFKGLRAYEDNYGWYKIDLPTEGHLKITVKTKIWGASISLFQADGKNRINSYLQMWPSDGKPGSDTGTVEYDLKAGTYYLSVFGPYTGEYRITTEFPPTKGKVDNSSTTPAFVDINIPELSGFGDYIEVEQGASFSLPGKIMSKDKITKVTAGIVGWKDTAATAEPNTNEFDLSNLRIDTSTWGIPVTGQFTINLWAKTESYTDPQVALGSISLTVYPKWKGVYAPRSLVASAVDNSSVILGWNRAEGATSYRIYCSEGDESKYVLVGTSTTETYRVSGLKASTYWFKVKSVSDSRESDFSNSARAVTGAASTNYPYNYRSLVYKFPGEDLRIKYAGLIDTSAKKYNVDPNLICSIINKETGFGPGKTSPAGARGMMQMMPDQGKKYGLSKESDFYDAEKNIDAGTHYISDLLYSTWAEAAQDKRAKLALASYNAGTPQVNKWICGAKESGYLDWWYKDWDKVKDYKGVALETRNYVDPIYSNWISTFTSARSVVYITLPQNGTVTEITDVNISWKPVAGVEKYKISAANVTYLEDFGTDGDNILETQVEGTSSSYTLSKSLLSPGKKYRVAVCPILSDGTEGEWAVTSFFTTISKPVFKTRDGYELINDGNNKIEWNTVDGAEEYRVALSDITNPEDEKKENAPKVLEITSNGTKTVFDVQGYLMKDGHRYRFYVEAVDRNKLTQGKSITIVFKQKNKPSVISSSPKTGDSKVELNSNIEINFNKIINKGDGFGKISLSDDRGNNIAFSAEMIQNSIIVKPKLLNSNTKYSLIIPANAIGDLYNNVLTKEYNLTFTTTSDTIAPKLYVNPAGDTYSSPQYVKITASEDVSVYYTTNGSEPALTSTKFNGSITIDKTCVLKYFAIDKNNNRTQVFTESYSILSSKADSLTVSSSVKQGSYKEAQLITLKPSRTAAIYYTINGTEPTVNSTKYTSPIKVSSSCTLKYYAVDGKGIKSNAYSQSYIIDSERPQINVSGIKDGMLVDPGITQITANVNDMSNIQLVSLEVDGTEIAKNYSKNLTYNWDTRQSMAGQHVITLRARDYSGNETINRTSVTVLPINQSPYKDGKKRTDTNWDITYNPSTRVLTAAVDAQLNSKTPLVYHICIIGGDTSKELYEGNDELTRIYPTQFDRYYSRSWSIDEFPGVREGGSFKIGIKIEGINTQISGTNYLDIQIDKSLDPNSFWEARKDLWVFPVKGIKNSKNNFNEQRTGRSHAGVDLFAPTGTEVISMTDGKVINVEYNFWPSTPADMAKYNYRTHAVWVRNSDGSVIRYGEVIPNSAIVNKFKSLGEVSIKKGELLGTIAFQTGDTMLHLEAYLGIDKHGNPINGGNLSITGNKTYYYENYNMNYGPFNRREDLINPKNVVVLPLIK